MVGLVGLIMRGRAGEVEPVVVTASHRRKGVGRALLGTSPSEARKRSMTSLTISPASRNVDAIRSLHAAGYDVVSVDRADHGPATRHGDEWRTARTSS